MLGNEKNNLLTFLLLVSVFANNGSSDGEIFTMGYFLQNQIFSRENVFSKKYIRETKNEFFLTFGVLDMGKSLSSKNKK